MQIFSLQTLQLKHKRSSLLLRGMIAFIFATILLVFAAEFIARSPLGASLPAPSTGADSFLFDAKIYDLESQVRRDGRVDCLFVGSSVANTDIDPVIVERVYYEMTGQIIHCYNIGLPLMNGQNTAALTRALINRFHPRVIFYCMLSRDISPGESNADPIEHSRWVQANLRAQTLRSWPVNNIYSHRYLQAWRYWLIPENRSQMSAVLNQITPQGFEPKQGFNDPYPKAPPTSTSELQQIWSDANTLKSAAAFFGLQNQGVQIVLIEAPQYRDPATNFSADPFWLAYETIYIPPLQQIAARQNSQFWRTDEISMRIPKAHWHDWIHLNAQGAATFSEWLGEQFAQNAWLFE